MTCHSECYLGLRPQGMTQRLDDFRESEERNLLLVRPKGRVVERWVLEGAVVEAEFANGKGADPISSLQWRRGVARGSDGNR